MISTKMFKPTLYFLFLSLMVSCSKDDDDAGNPASETYTTEVYLTDAPIDNAEVKGVFVTIAEVKVNGLALEGFQKTTIDVSSLSNGTTKLLGNVELEAGSTSDIELVLDAAADASGNAPGNYVVTTSGEKKVLTTTSNSISLSDQAEILAIEENELILDFDLRKSISQNAEGEYSFVGSSQLSNSIRAVNRAETGTITGNISNMASASGETLVVYAYKAGSYSEGETQTGESGLNFTNAVSSTVVSESNGNFSLHFIEEGSYELVFASYEDEDNDGSLEFQGEAEMTLAGDLNLDGLSVTSNSTVELDLTFEGLLNL